LEILLDVREGTTNATVFVGIVLVEYCVLKGSAYCVCWYFEWGSCVNIAWHCLLHGLLYIVYDSLVRTII
jgi:hypothetical protein